MAVHIEHINDREILVNNKLVVKDSSDDWVAKADLDLEEIRAFQEHITSS